MDVHGNERADSLVSQTPIANMMTIGRPELLQTKKKCLMKNEITIEDTTRMIVGVGD